MPHHALRKRRLGAQCVVNLEHATHVVVELHVFQVGDGQLDETGQRLCVPIVDLETKPVAVVGETKVW